MFLGDHWRLPAAVALVGMMVSCSSPSPNASPSTAGSTTAPAATNTAASGVGDGAASPVPWPVTECGTYSGEGCAPVEALVDLDKPVFSRPTEITNPLYPISQLESVVLLGNVDDLPFRSETTLLPYTDKVVWDGQEIEVALVQYLAYKDGRITEVALDRYAQADDG